MSLKDKWPTAQNISTLVTHQSFPARIDYNPALDKGSLETASWCLTELNEHTAYVGFSSKLYTCYELDHQKEIFKDISSKLPKEYCYWKKDLIQSPLLL